LEVFEHFIIWQWEAWGIANQERRLRPSG